ncbi:MAG: hypothetical protein REH83_07210, partial [Rickettsiella sp.]|nr:hypothetical protein [Rickettsiella sp.]
NGTDLIITNVLDETNSADDFYTIICSRFYELAEMREKVLSMTFIFLDQALALKDYEEQINSTISFSSVFNNSQLLRSDLSLQSTTNLTDVPVSQTRAKRELNFQFEKSASSSATKVFSLVNSLVNWAKEGGHLFFSKINDYARGLSKKIYSQKALTQFSENTLMSAGEQEFKPYCANESTKIKQTLNVYSKNETKNVYSKCNNFYKHLFFTQAFDYHKAKSSSVSFKHQANYRKVIFPENDVSLYQDTQFHSQGFFSTIKANVDVNETLVFANYLLQTIGKKINS